MGPTWGLSGADRTQVGAMLTPWTLLSGFNQDTVIFIYENAIEKDIYTFFQFQ